jgi:hypothetical protein
MPNPREQNLNSGTRSVCSNLGPRLEVFLYKHVVLGVHLALERNVRQIRRDIHLARDL